MTDILKHHRIGYLDAVRVLAMVMVVAMHAPLPKSNTNSMFVFYGQWCLVAPQGNQYEGFLYASLRQGGMAYFILVIILSFRFISTWVLASL